MAVDMFLTLDGVKGESKARSMRRETHPIKIITMADQLDDKFKLNRAHLSGDQSIIDFAGSEEAKAIYKTSHNMLAKKIAKYEDINRTDLNSNVKQVLEYLRGFLASIGC